MRFASCLLFGLASIVACSATPPQSSSTKPPAAAASAPTGEELARAQAFVDARYTQDAVRHSFRTRFGESIDCIDFFAQEGVKMLAARGMPIATLPPPANRSAVAKDTSLSAAMFDGSLDENGNARVCSDTTVPQVRLTVETIEKAGGLDRYLSRFKKSPMHLRSQGRSEPAAPDSAGPAFAHAQTDFTGSYTFSTDRATLSVFTPSLTGNPGTNHSIEQTWTNSSGVFWSPSAPCSPNCLQTVEAGWSVDASLAEGNTSPILFVFSTPDGYESGCYDGPLRVAGASCPAWVALPGSPLAPGQILTSSDPTSSPPTIAELTVQVTQCSEYSDCSDGWEVMVRTDENAPLLGIGYYPSSDYSGTFATAATGFSAGGEVYDATDYDSSTGTDGWNVAMGSGSSAAAGYGKAGYVHDYAVYLTGDPLFPFDAPYSTIPTNYAVSTHAATPGTPEAGWDGFFYLGALPGCAPATCASLGVGCGVAADGCGGELSCGSCVTGEVCTTSSQCCTPKTVAEACGVLSCGVASDGCGGTVTCPATCGANEYCDANSCVAVPLCPQGCATGYICEAPTGPPGVCVKNERCKAPTKYCNGECIAQSARCP